MKQKTVDSLNDLFTIIVEADLDNNDPGFISSELYRIIDSDKVEFKYDWNFTHPQLSPNDMLYIGHFLNLPFCLDLGCPGSVHVLTGRRNGMVDEWEWYRSFGEALKGAKEVVWELIGDIN